MFRLGYKSRQFLCRLGFLLGCLAPTAGVCAWGITRMLPGHAAGIEAELSRASGLHLTFARVTHPRPGLMLLEDVALTDPETGATVLRAAAVRIGMADADVAIVAQAPVIEASAAPRLLAALADGLATYRAAPGSGVRLAAGEATLRWELAGAPASAGPPEYKEEKLSAVSVRIEALAAGPQGTIEFQREAATSPLRLTLFRDRQSTPPRDGFELETGPATIDAAFLGTLLPGEAWLGPRATFSGYIWARRDAGGWQGLANGTLSGVDLHALVDGRIPHDLQGAARIGIAQVRFDGGRLLNASGSIDAGPGFISRGLLSAASRSLHLPWNELRGPNDDLLAYDQLAVAFEIDAAGLSLSGQCNDAPAGAIVMSDERVLLAEPRQQPQPASALVRLLADTEAELVPASPRTAWLLRVLPAAH